MIAKSALIFLLCYHFVLSLFKMTAKSAITSIFQGFRGFSPNKMRQRPETSLMRILQSPPPLGICLILTAKSLPITALISLPYTFPISIFYYLYPSFFHPCLLVLQTIHSPPTWQDTQLSHLWLFATC